MPRNISVIVINASRQRVWDMLTKPEYVKLWQFGSDLITTWEPESPIRFVAEWNGQTFEQWGHVLVYKPYEAIQYSLFAPRPDLEDKPENYFVMCYELSDQEDNTRLVITQIDNRPDAIQEEPQGEENPVLQQLKQLAESNEH